MSQIRWPVLIFAAAAIPGVIAAATLSVQASQEDAVIKSTTTLVQNLCKVSSMRMSGRIHKLDEQGADDILRVAASSPSIIRVDIAGPTGEVLASFATDAGGSGEPRSKLTGNDSVFMRGPVSTDHSLITALEAIPSSDPLEPAGYIRIIARPQQISTADAFRTVAIPAVAASLIAFPLLAVMHSKASRGRQRLGACLRALRDSSLDEIPTRLKAIDDNDDRKSLALITDQIRVTGAYKTFFQNAFHSMVDSLIIIDSDLKMRAVNQATIDMLGFKEDELVGATVTTVWVDTRGYYLNGERIKHLLRDGARSDHELAYRTKDGKVIPISFSGSAIREEGEFGPITGYVCLGTDISERKRAEHERKKLNQELVDTSRRAGMADVATGVLHNVGNVLNSVGVSTSTLSDILRRTRAPRLKQAVEMIGQHEDDLAAFLTDDERGRKIPTYLAHLADALLTEQTEFQRELEELTTYVEHMKEIIRVQQRFANPTGVAEPVEIVNLIDDALRIRDTSYSKYDVRIIKQYGYKGEIKTDRHKVLQILINLVKNAVDAMAETDNQVRQLRVSSARAPDGSHIRIEVADSGVGIPDEFITKIFTHGFTTKKEGHGFGLHSAAIAAKELGGSLSARNNEDGPGACFSLCLPLTHERETAA